MRFFITALSLTTAFAGSSLASDSAEPCAHVADFIAKGALKFSAELAVACLSSVPYNQTGAVKFIDFFNNSVIQWHSTKAYLKAPPRSYQQNPVDLDAELNSLKTKASNGTYRDAYSFERDVQLLLTRAKDTHLGITTGLMKPFAFGPPINFVSISSDGKELPRLFVQQDLIVTATSSAEWKPSEVKTINGIAAVDYLKAYARNYTNGYVELHTEYNQLMSAPVFSIGASYNSWISMGGVFTDPWLNVTFANGSSSRNAFFAIPFDAATQRTLRSGKDYQQVYLDSTAPTKMNPSDPSDAPETQDTSDAPDTSATSAESASQAVATTAPTSLTQTGWKAAAYPRPFLAMPSLGSSSGTGTGQYATAYFVDDKKTAVFSLNSFGMSGDDATIFVAFIEEFIKQAQAASVKRILFDMQGNGGGSVLLAYEMFRQFFPDEYPYGGYRGRFQHYVDALGDASTMRYKNARKSKNETDAERLAVNPYVADPWINAKTGKLFKDWDELARHYTSNGDEFLQTQIHDFSSPSVISSGTGGDAGAFKLESWAGWEHKPADKRKSPWRVEDMAILTDGACASTCSVFVEIFKHQMNVSTVVVGGLPEHGAMQAVGGVRGSRAFTLEALKADVDEIEAWFPGDIHAPLPILNRTGILVDSGGFNLWDNVRENETFPQQFAYQAADCRLFFTADTWNNYTNLWTRAARAVFDDHSLCVEGSTGHPSALRPYFTDICGPAKDCVQEDSKWGTKNQTYYVNDMPVGLIQNATKYSGQEYGDAKSSKGGPTGATSATDKGNDQKKSAAESIAVNKGMMILLLIVAGALLMS